MYTYVFGNDPSDGDFNSICRNIKRYCPGYAQGERKSYGKDVESVSYTKGKMMILAELTRGLGCVTVCSDEPLPRLESLSRRWKGKGYGFVRTLRRAGYFLAGTRTKRKFILLPLLLALIVAVSGFVMADSFSEGIILGFYGMFRIIEDLFIDGFGFGWLFLIPIGIMLHGWANTETMTETSDRMSTGEGMHGENAAHRELVTASPIGEAGVSVGSVGAVSGADIVYKSRKELGKADRKIRETLRELEKEYSVLSAEIVLPGAADGIGKGLKSITEKIGNILRREKDFLLLTAGALLPALAVVYGGNFISVYNWLADMMSTADNLLCYPLIGAFIFGLPFLIIGEMILRSLEKRNKLPSLTDRLVMGILSAAAVVTAACCCSDIYNGAYNKRYEHEYYRVYLAEQTNVEARRENFLSLHEQDMRDIARYAVKYSCYDWTECPDKSLERQWEAVFLDGYADY
ncbi:MAG: hypothetical protein NC078_12960, partial [Ruminococcus sp.]|nr:hypothetical protein [Ruminococcus sp.]